jgi:hypothetical protein
MVDKEAEAEALQHREEQLLETVEQGQHQAVEAVEAEDAITQRQDLYRFQEMVEQVEMHELDCGYLDEIF